MSPISRLARQQRAEVIAQAAAASAGAGPCPSCEASKNANKVAPSVEPTIRVVEISAPADALRSGGAERIMTYEFGEMNRPIPAPPSINGAASKA